MNRFRKNKIIYVLGLAALMVTAFPLIALAEEEAAAIGKRQIPGSVSYIPGIAGLLLAGEVIKDLIR
jgi:tRNA A37 threonylcarbamoyladenosine dehydratase